MGEVQTVAAVGAVEVVVGKEGDWAVSMEVETGVAALGVGMVTVVGAEGKLASVRVGEAELAGGEAASTPTWPDTR